jgi:predicted PurR-regulated permease PerM
MLVVPATSLDTVLARTAPVPSTREEVSRALETLEAFRDVDLARPLPGLGYRQYPQSPKTFSPSPAGADRPSRGPPAVVLKSLTRLGTSSCKLPFTMPHGEAERARFVLLIFYVIVLVIGYLAFLVVEPFLAALAWAAVFAMVMYPIRDRMAKRLGETWGASAATALAVLVIVVPAIAVLALLVREVTTQVHTVQASGFALPTPARIQEWWDTLRGRLPVLALPPDPTSAVADVMKTIASFLATRVTWILGNLANVVFQLFVMLFGLFFFFRDGGRMVDRIRQLLPFEQSRRDLIIRQTHDLVVATVGSTFAVAAVQGALTGLALGLLGFRAPVFWGVMTAFLSLVPMIGSGLIWGPAVVWLLLSGELWRGVILLAVGVGVIGTSDNFLRPILLSGRTTMNGLLVFVSLLGGMAAFGFIGLVLGPVIVAAMDTLLEAAVLRKDSPVPAPSKASH